MTGGNFLPLPVFLLLHPLPCSLKRAINGVGASDVRPWSTVRHGIGDLHWAFVSANRVRCKATFDPVCRGVVLGNTKRGRRRRRNENALPLFSDGFAPSCDDIGR